MGACRKQFGTSVVNILNEMSASERKKVHAFDSDLEGSVGLTAVEKIILSVLQEREYMKEEIILLQLVLDRRKGIKGFSQRFQHLWRW